MRRFFPIALIALLLSAGCTGTSDGSEGSDGGTGDPSASSSPTPTGPECADIWKAGKTLPEDYTTCVRDGAVATQEVYECTDDTKLVAYNDSMYAVTGDEIFEPEIQPFQDTEEYGQVYADCTGE